MINIVKRQFRGTNWAKDWVEEMQVLKGPGFKDIKWSEMYDGWREFIPEQHRREFIGFAQDPSKKCRKKIAANLKKATDNWKGRLVTKRNAGTKKKAPLKKKPAPKKCAAKKAPAAKRAKK